MASDDTTRAVTSLGLRGKALVLLVVAVAAVSALAYFVLSPWVGASFEAQLSQRGSVLAAVLEQHQALRLALSLHNKKEAERAAADLLAGDRDLAWVVLLDGDDHVLGMASRDALAGDALAHVVTAHLQDRAHASADVTARGESDGVQRFTRVVKGADANEGDDLAILAGDLPTKAAKPLGSILLGLSAKEARSRLDTQTFLTIGLTALFLAGAFFVFFSSIARRLRRMGAFASRIAAGDLSEDLKDGGRDEISQLAGSLQEMSGRTGTVVQQLQDAASALTRVSTELLASSSQQSEAASRQAVTVAETGATVAHLRDAFQQAADRAQTVIDLAQKSEASTTSGKTSVEESVGAMEALRDQVLAMAQTIQTLVERTTQIGSIVEVVKDLAEQSNVLALNAAIEAAKAGEHGRGFAVVAREVRTLAERSKSSTEQIRAILKDIEKATREAMGTLEEGTRRSASGMALAHRAGEAIVGLDRAINDSSSAAVQIAATTRQQAVGVDQIWQAMREIDRAVNESASGIRLLEGASRNMKELAEQMTGLVSRYKVNRTEEVP